MNKTDNIFFEINNKSAKSLLYNQRNLTANKAKQQKNNKMNRLSSLQHIETPYYYEPAAIETQRQQNMGSFKDLEDYQNIANYINTSNFLKSEGSLKIIEENKHNDELCIGPPANVNTNRNESSQNVGGNKNNTEKKNKEKENEEVIESIHF